MVKLKAQLISLRESDVGTVTLFKELTLNEFVDDVVHETVLEEVTEEIPEAAAVIKGETTLALLLAVDTVVLVEKLGTVEAQVVMIVLCMTVAEDGVTLTVVDVAIFDIEGIIFEEPTVV